MYVPFYIRKVFVVALLTAFLYSCAKEKKASGTVTVPQTKNIPHYNDDHIAITKRTSFSQLPDKPDVLVALHNYLVDPDKFTPQKLNVIATVNEVISLGKNKLLMLDSRDNRLFEYDVKNDSSIDVATHGKGPGDLNFAIDMEKGGDTVYVAQNMQVSRFNCGISPCAYIGTTELKTMPYSLALDDSSMAVSGSMIVRGAKGPKLNKKLDNLKAVHVVNASGKEIGEFGDTYKTVGQWMLLQPFVSESLVRYSPAAKTFLLAFKRFPLIYTYSDDFKLKHTYKIDGFILGKQNYDTRTGMLKIVEGDYSRINQLQAVGEHDVLVEMDTYTNRHAVNKHYVSDHKIDYYAVYPGIEKSYYIGGLTLKNSDMNESIYPTSQGLIISKKGSLYWVPMTVKKKSVIVPHYETQ